MGCEITAFMCPRQTDILSGLSSLEELEWHKEDPYTVLPHLQTSSSLSYLSLFSTYEPPLRENYQQQLIKVIYNNSTALRNIELDDLHTVGLNSLTSFLTPIQSCCNLVSLGLNNSPFPSDDISYWDTAIPYLVSSGIESCCYPLTRHRTNDTVQKYESTSCYS